MSTPALIGKLNADGTVISIFCRLDGYLDGVGKTLQHHYQDADKIDNLIALGDLYCLGDEIGEKFDAVNEPRNGKTVSMIRDLEKYAGNDFVPEQYQPRISQSIDDFYAENFIDGDTYNEGDTTAGGWNINYFYLYDGTQWGVNTGDPVFAPQYLED